MARESFRTIGVIGAGTMGVALAVDLAIHALQVILVDRTEERLDSAGREITQGARAAMLLNKQLPRVATAVVRERITMTTNLAHVDKCDFVVENIVEDIRAKREVFEQLDAVCPKETPFGANTSCISIIQLGSFTRRPERVVGMHLMNPVYLKSCVEVIRGHHTSDATVDEARTLLTHLQKEAIVVNDFPGFVSNRISHLFMNEAAFVVQDQVADPRSVDQIFKRCYGHPMGPLETADLIGLDTVVNSLDVLYESYQDAKFRCCPLLRKMVQAGLHGVKSGRGFYEYHR